MDILETLATNSGILLPEQISAPPSSYSPITEQYITIVPEEYPHWLSVIEFLFPVLSANKIQIVQLTGNLIQNCQNKIGLNIRQSTFLIANAQLHISPTSLFYHVAESTGTPQISLLGDAASIPQYKSIQKGLRAVSGLIKDIPPEEIANAIFEGLGLEARVRLKTRHIGHFYQIPQINYIPNSVIDFQKVADSRLVVRMDLAFNEQLLFQVLQVRKTPVLVHTKNYLSEQILKVGKPLISQVIQYIEEGFDISGLEILKKSGIPYMLIWTGKKENLADAKLQLFDYNQVVVKSSKRVEVSPETYFRTRQFFISKNNVYPTIWHVKNDRGGLGDFQIGEAIDSEDFWENPEMYYFFNL